MSVTKPLVYLGPRFSPDTEVPGMMVGDPQGSWTYYDDDAARTAEVYRKALEPFMSTAQHAHYEGGGWISIEVGVLIPSEHWTAIREACRLMGIKIAA